MIDNPSKFMNEKRAAAYLGLSRKTLEKWRNQGKGPPYKKFGRNVMYSLYELDGWAEAQTRHSTSEV